MTTHHPKTILIPLTILFTFLLCSTSCIPAVQTHTIKNQIQQQLSTSDTAPETSVTMVSQLIAQRRTQLDPTTPQYETQNLLLTFLLQLIGLIGMGIIALPLLYILFLLFFFDAVDSWLTENQLYPLLQQLLRFSYQSLSGLLAVIVLIFLFFYIIFTQQPTPTHTLTTNH
ncbi:MAG: hypothetical protein KKC68_04800 [Candidatus Thermoplasmatota archaeon]|nr:hypothetical protein [Candidatus Thermoplasmatota archaeon]MBU1941071.1 hypothetical protein [Candidatus Thermoplasmatota archaeon]